MSAMNVIINQNQPDPYCTFRFQDQNDPNRGSNKIMVKQSRICDFMYRMEKGLVFKDDKKEVRFQKVNGGIRLDTVVNGKSYPYTLYESEKQQVEDWIVANL